MDKYVIGIFMIIILAINTLGCIIIYNGIEKRHAELLAGQKQIAGFLMIPGSQHTGPIRVFYDVGCEHPERKKQKKIKE